MKKLTFFFLMLSFFVSSVFGQTTIYVNSTSGSDTNSGSSSSPFRTFYKAYQTAASGDIINLTGTITWTDANEVGDAQYTGFTLSKNLTINGQGADVTIVQAASSFNTADRRVFTVAAGYTVYFNKLTIRYGANTLNAYDGLEGGGIHNKGTLFVDKCRITQNRANSASWGGYGGGVDNFGTATIKNSTIDNNYADSQGGGLCNHYTASANNRMDVINCTIAFNETAASVATVGGAGIYIRSGTVSVTNSTIAYNNAINGGTGGTSGIDIQGALIMKNSILARNKSQGNYVNAASGNVFDLSNSGSFTDNGGNIIGKFNTAWSGVSPNATTWWDVNGNGAGDNVYRLQSSASTTGPLNLSTTLALNGSINKTETLALTSESIAIDGGVAGANGSIALPLTDQLGFLRTSTSDIGAFEFGGINPQPTVTNLSPNPVIVGQTLTITGTNLTGATSVTINGASVPFTVASATSITVVVPTGTATGNVIVTTANGSSTGVQVTVSNAPYFTSTPVLTATVGSPYTSSITVSNASNNPVSITANTTLPAWLSLSGGSSSATTGQQIGGTINRPGAGASDANGNFYAIENYGTGIYKITPDGTTTLWAQKLAINGAFYTYGGALVVGNYLYVSLYDCGNGGIVKYDLNATNPTGTVVYNGGDIMGMAYQNGYLYGASYCGGKIIRIDLSTNVLSDYLTGLPNQGPFGIGITPTGEFIIPQYGLGELRKYSGTTLISTIATSSNPTDVKVDAEGNVYVSYYNSAPIRKYKADFSSYVEVSGTVTSVWGMSMSSTGVLTYPAFMENAVYRLQTGATLGGTPAIGDIGTHPVSLKATDTVTSAFSTQDFTVTVYGPSTFSVSNLAKSTLQAPFVYTDPASNSTGAFTYSSSNSSIVSVSGNTFTMVGPGTATITVTQAAAGLYTQTSKTFTINVVSPPTITSIAPNPVTAGQTLTISGTFFTGATNVTINGSGVPFTVVSATSITVVIPVGTNSGKVTVTTPAGTADGAVQIASNTTAPVTTGWTNAWQTLSTSSAGYLKSVTLKLDNTDANNDYGLYLELYNTDADPSSANPWNKFTGTPLETSATLTMLRNTASGEVTFTFPGTVKLNANSTYYVRLKEASGNPGGTGLQGINKLSSTSGTTNGGAGNNFGTLYYKFSMAPHLTVINPPIISTTGTLTPFSTCAGTPSAVQNFTVNGTYLTAPISATAPTGFEISRSATDGFSSSLTVGNYAASTSPGSIEWCYITPDASTGQTIVHVDLRQFTGGVLPEDVNQLQLLDLYTGPVTYLSNDPYWAVYSIPVDLSNLSGSAYAANYRVMGYGDVAITIDFQFTSVGTTISRPIYVRLSASATGTPSGNVTLSTTGTTPVNVAVSGTVNAKPAAPSVTNLTACQNTSLSALTATGTNLLWYTGATGGVGSATAPTPSASSPGTTSYWVTQTNASGCESDRAQIDVVVNPAPTVDQPTNLTIQNGTPSGVITFTGAVSGTSYAWTNSTPAIGLAPSGTGNIASFVASVPSGTSQQQVTATITVTPSANGCVGSPKTFTITVNLNAPPTDIALSKANSFEANALGATVANLSSTDPDAGDTHSYILAAGSGGGDNASFTIVGNQLKANVVFNYAAKRLYAVRIRSTDAGGLSFEKEFLISISKTPVVLGTGNLPSTKQQTAASANPSISKGYASYLTVTGENLTGYSWSPSTALSATNVANPVASPAQTTTYYVTVTNSFGSTTVVPITINVMDDYNVTPNNLLTPNGDGVNDTWAVDNIASYPNNEVKVFDKAGRLVFTQKGYANTWDASNLITDTYYYIIIFAPDVAPKKGFITIIR